MTKLKILNHMTNEFIDFILYDICRQYDRATEGLTKKRKLFVNDMNDSILQTIVKKMVKNM